MDDKDACLWDSFISKFFGKFCRPTQSPNLVAMEVLLSKLKAARSRKEIGLYNDLETFSDCEIQQLLFSTGSSVEFFINLPLPCIGDTDILLPLSGVTVTRGLLDESQTCKENDAIYVIVHPQNHPGFVYLVLLSRQPKLSITRTALSNTFCWHESTHDVISSVDSQRVQGPAVNKYLVSSVTYGGVREERTIDIVRCIPCPFWPSEAADWVTRRRQHSWPSQSTIRPITCGDVTLYQLHIGTVKMT